MPIDRNSAQYITGAIYKPTQTSAPGVWDLDDQANNLSKNLWPLPPQAIQRSLRFNSADSAYLNRTPASAGNQRTWTWSGWVKRSKLSSGNAMFSTVNGSAFNYFSFGTGGGGDQIQFAYYNGSTDIFNVNTGSISFRDTNSWYHIVLAVDTTLGVSANTVKIYVNGIQQTLGGIFPSQNYDTPINSAISHIIGGGTGGYTNYLFNGYIAEVNFINSQQLDATSFGETDQQTGVWIPKRYTGTYGTNGFRLSFANNSSTTALGYDSSGQGNNWTPNNFSVTPGVGNDSLLDVPSLYGTDTGLGGEVIGNYATLNPLEITTLTKPTNGNLDYSPSNTAPQVAISTITIPSTGKWYAEFTKGSSTSSFSIGAIGALRTAQYVGHTDSIGYFDAGQIYKDGSLIQSNLATYASGDVVGVAIDVAAQTIQFYKNGVVVGTAVSYTYSQISFACGNYVSGQVYNANFGQRPFAYPAPTGYKALCTTNLPAPAIGQTSNNQASNHFAAVTYTGNNGTQTISTLGFQPDFVWIKNRTGANSHILVDSIRGAGKGLSSESTAIEYNIPTDFQSFNSNGFTVGYGGTNITNASANNYVAWCWNAGGVSVTNNAGTNGASVASTYRANKAAGFSIVSWTYNGAATIAHGLNAVPKFMIIRGKNAVYNWDVYHASIGPTVRLVLNSTSGSQTYSGPFNNTTPTSSVFSQGAAWYNNGDSLIGYIFAEIPGYSAFGKYDVGTDLPFIYTGFKPAFVMIKSYSGAYDQAYASWTIYDNKRNPTNKATNPLFANLSAAEGARGNGSSQPNVLDIDLLSNGFKILVGATEISYGSHIYAAFAETPARLSTAR